MKKLSLFFFLGILLVLSGCSRKEPSGNENKILIGNIDTLESKILGETRKIWVYNPQVNSMVTSQKFPVVYLFDGDAHFYSVMGLLQQLSQVNGNMILPQMILVGIPNTDRTRDLTPTHVTSDGMNDTTFLKPSGGGENFALFLEKELIPFVDSNYPTAPYRTVIGHSFGGLTVMNLLINHTGLFNSYIAIDPSMWWDNRKLLDQARTDFSQKDFTGKSLYLGIANTMDPGMDTNKVRSDTSSATRHIRSILDLNNLIEENKQNNLRYSWKYYNTDDHGSVPLITEYDGLRFIFDFYRPSITGAQIRDTTFNIEQALRSYAEKVSEKMGYKFNPPEALLNALGYQFLGRKLYDRASSVFKLNIEYYPGSPNVYDSMGELLMVQGDTAASIEHYEKSLQLNPKNENAKEKIRLMKEKKER